MRTIFQICGNDFNNWPSYLTYSKSLKSGIGVILGMNTSIIFLLLPVILGTRGRVSGREGINVLKDLLD